MRIETHPDGLATTSDYWDCECEHNFIHARGEGVCLACGATREEQPDSRVDEVKAHETGGTNGSGSRESGAGR